MKHCAYFRVGTICFTKFTKPTVRELEIGDCAERRFHPRGRVYCRCPPAFNTPDRRLVVVSLEWGIAYKCCCCLSGRVGDAVAGMLTRTLFVRCQDE